MPRNISSDLEKLSIQVEDDNNSVDFDDSSVDDSLKENDSQLDFVSSGYSSSVSEKEDCESQPNLLLAAILNSVAEDSVSCSKDSSRPQFVSFSEMEKPFLGNHETKNSEFQISSETEHNPVNEALVNETLSQILQSIMVQ